MVVNREIGISECIIPVTQALILIVVVDAQLPRYPYSHSRLPTPDARLLISGHLSAALDISVRRNVRITVGTPAILVRLRF